MKAYNLIYNNRIYSECMGVWEMNEKERAYLFDYRNKNITNLIAVARVLIAFDKIDFSKNGI